MSDVRTAALVAGSGLAAMAVLAPIGVFAVLPNSTSTAALIILIVAGLDVVVAVALWPVLRSGGDLLAMLTAALRIAYGSGFAVAAGALASGDAALFQWIWDAALLLFGAHLAVAGSAMIRSQSIPGWIGVLLLMSGLGHAYDSVSAVLGAAGGFEVSAVTFVGEVVLIVWLFGWAGRPRHRSSRP